MHTINAAAFRRLALVLGLLGGLAGIHAGFSIPSAEAGAPAGTRAVVEAVTAGSDRAAADYGHGTCGEEECRIEYCPAPPASEHEGYAVPCAGLSAG